VKLWRRQGGAGDDTTVGRGSLPRTISLTRAHFVPDALVSRVGSAVCKALPTV
jgi:hypothetical protein